MPLFFWPYNSDRPGPIILTALIIWMVLAFLPYLYQNKCMNEQEYKIHFGYGKSDDENLWCCFSTSPNKTEPNQMKWRALSFIVTLSHIAPSLVLLQTFSLCHFNCFAFSTVIIIKFISEMINRNSTNTHSLTHSRTQIKLWYSYLHIHIRHVDPVNISSRCTWLKFSSVLLYINHRKMMRKKWRKFNLKWKLKIVRSESLKCAHDISVMADVKFWWEWDTIGSSSLKLPAHIDAKFLFSWLRAVPVFPTEARSR